MAPGIDYHPKGKPWAQALSRNRTLGPRPFREKGTGREELRSSKIYIGIAGGRPRRTVNQNDWRHRAAAPACTTHIHGCEVGVIINRRVSSAIGSIACPSIATKSMEVNRSLRSVFTEPLHCGFVNYAGMALRGPRSLENHVGITLTRPRSLVNYAASALPGPRSLINLTKINAF